MTTPNAISKGWPIIGRSGVAGVCRKICESIEKLERAFEEGELSNRLASGDFDQILGPKLYETYGRLTAKTPGPLHHLRIDAVRALVAQLQNDLVPTQVAHAEVCMLTEDDSWAAKPGANSPPRLPFKLVDASFDGAPITNLRLDQMLSARFWRVGFTFKTPDFCDAFAQRVVWSATDRLANDVLSVQKILDRFRPKMVNPELKIVPHPAERRFEHLILDILNEDDSYARMASVVEDFLEKTDLRVRYPGLERRRGARVQLTSITQPELHKTKLEGIKLAREFVFLSPLSLAEFVNFLHTSAGSKFGSFALAPLWGSLAAKPTNVIELASELKRIMFHAMTGAPDSPLGPMAKVPQPIRQLVRVFVEAQAVGSTYRLRERELRRINYVE